MADGPSNDAGGDPDAGGAGPILLFDGVCNLCNGTVQFVVRHDPEGRVRFAPLQSDAGRALLANCGSEAAGGPDAGPDGDVDADSGASGNADADMSVDADATADAPESVVLVEDGQCFARSEAALRVARHLEFPYRLLAGLRAVPRPIRDVVYDLVARYRYRIFGKRDRCMTPTPEIDDRFLAYSDPE